MSAVCWFFGRQLESKEIARLPGRMPVNETAGVYAMVVIVPAGWGRLLHRPPSAMRMVPLASVKELRRSDGKPRLCHQAALAKLQPDHSTTPSLLRFP